MHNLSDNFEGDGIERIKTLNYYNFFLETDAKKVGGKKVATEKKSYFVWSEQHLEL